MTERQRGSQRGRARALGFSAPVRVRAVPPVCPCYTSTIPAILLHIPAVIGRGQRVAGAQIVGMHDDGASNDTVGRKAPSLSDTDLLTMGMDEVPFYFQIPNSICCFH